MERTVVNDDLDVDHRIAGDHAALHCLTDARLDGVDVLFRNHAADNLVLEAEALARLLRDEFEPAVTVLTVTAGLADELALCLDGLADGFAVCHLRLANLAVHLELTKHTVHDDLQMQLAHP